MKRSANARYFRPVFKKKKKTFAHRKKIKDAHLLKKVITYVSAHECRVSFLRPYNMQHNERKPIFKIQKQTSSLNASDAYEL